MDSGPPTESASLNIEGQALTQRFAARIRGEAYAYASAASGSAQVEQYLYHANTFLGGVDIHDFGLASEVDFFVQGPPGTNYAIALDYVGDAVLPSYYGRSLSCRVSAVGLNQDARNSAWSGILSGTTTQQTVQHGGMLFSHATTVRIATSAGAGYSCIIGCQYTPWNVVIQHVKLNARALIASPRIEVSPVDLDFGRVDCRKAVSRSITIRNSGLGTLAGHIESSPNNDTAFALFGETDFRLGPNEDFRFDVTFSGPPGRPLDHSAKFLITSNDPCSPNTVLSAVAEVATPLARFVKCEKDVLLTHIYGDRLIVRMYFESSTGHVADLAAFVPTGSAMFREFLSPGGPNPPPSPPFVPLYFTPQVGSMWYPGDVRYSSANLAYILDGHGPDGNRPYVINPYSPAGYTTMQAYDYNPGGDTGDSWYRSSDVYEIRKNVVREGNTWHWRVAKSGQEFMRGLPW